MNQIPSWVATEELSEHPIHKNCFLEADKKTKTEHYHASIDKYGKIKPVVYVEQAGQKLVIDGWSYVLYALEQSIDKVPAKCVIASSDEDVLRLTLELQFSDHNTTQEEYRIYKEAMNILSKGRGHRSDLKDDVEPTDGKKRRPTVYDRIAAMTGASSGKRVQQLIKVGDVNPHYLEHMEEEKASLSTAYLNCISEERGDLPPAPAVKAPVFVKDITPVPEFGQSVTSDGEFTADDYTEDGSDVTPTGETGSGIPECETVPVVVPADIVSDATADVSPGDDGQYIAVPGVCTGCGCSTTVKITLSELLKLKQWNTKN